MDSERPSSALGIGNILIGGLVGALTGAFFRFSVAVAVAFLFPKFMGRGEDEGVVFQELFLHVVPIISALVGLVVGGIAGASCRPILGILFGAILSAGCCLGMGVFPALTLAQGDESFAFLVAGLAAMTIAGAVAGGIGAWAGRSFPTKSRTVI